MDQYTQKEDPGKQGRFGKIAIIAVLAVALAMVGLLPGWTGSLGAHPEANTTLQSTPPANNSLCAPGLLTAAEPASLVLSTNADADATPMTMREPFDGTTTAQVCYWGYCRGVYGCWYACW